MSLKCVTDLKEDDRKKTGNKRSKGQWTEDTPKCPTFLSATTFTLLPPEPPQISHWKVQWDTNRRRKQMEDPYSATMTWKFKNIRRHESSKTLEDID